MKKIISQTTIILCIALTVLSGCRKDETKIEKWIVGTWDLDRYEEQDFKDGVLADEKVSTNQGKISFDKDGTGKDSGGEFIGGEFKWSNTDETLILTSGSGTTVYDIEEFSKSDFIFSITDRDGDDKFVERWFLSK